MLQRFRQSSPVSWPSRRQALATLFVLLCSAASARAAFQTVINSGPAANRVNAFFLGDGYTAADISSGKYATHVQNYVSYMFSNTLNSDPFYRYRNFFDVYQVDVVSNQAGADEPQNGVVRDTALDAKYRYDGSTDRLLYISDSKADAALNAAISGSGITAQLRFVTVNDSIYGGGGGKYSVYAGANSSAREIALHEMAHSFSGLADEYGGFASSYPYGEPTANNLTKNSSGAKWSRWTGYNDPTGSVVGAYQGGGFYDLGVYRPTADSKMRSLGVPFNAVSREKLILDIYARVHPLDSYTSNSSTLIDPASLSITRVDSSVISSQWFVDGVLETTFAGMDSLDFASLNLSAGLHTVKVRAFDPTGFDPVNGWVRMNQTRLEQFVSWNVMVSPPAPDADFNADGIVDGGDFLIWQRGLGSGTTVGEGDADHDGDADGSDLAVWTSSFGAASGAETNGVPEPSTFVVLFAALVGYRGLAPAPSRSTNLLKKLGSPSAFSS